MAGEERDLEANCADTKRRLLRTYTELASLWERSCPSTRWEQLLSLEDKEGLFFALKDLDLSFERLRFLERLGERLEAKTRRSGVLRRGPYHSANFEELKTETERLLEELGKDVVVLDHAEEERFLERKRRIISKLEKVTQLLESCKRSKRGALSYLSGKTVGLWLAAFAGACALGYVAPVGVVGSASKYIYHQGRSVLPFALEEATVRSLPAAFVGVPPAAVGLAHAVRRAVIGTAGRARASLEEPFAKRPRRN